MKDPYHQNSKTQKKLNKTRGDGHTSHAHSTVNTTIMLEAICQFNTIPTIIWVILAEGVFCGFGNWKFRRHGFSSLPVSVQRKAGKVE